MHSGNLYVCQFPFKIPPLHDNIVLNSLQLFGNAVFKTEKPGIGSHSAKNPVRGSEHPPQLVNPDGVPPDRVPLTQVYVDSISEHEILAVAVLLVYLLIN